VSEVIIIGLDIAKYVFHVHGADERGRAIFRKRISRGKLLDFFAARPSCTVALRHVVLADCGYNEARTHLSLSKGCAGFACRPGGWRHRCQAAPRRITPSIRSDLIFGRDKGFSISMIG
jgi:hypothetical protein